MRPFWRSPPPAARDLFCPNEKSVKPQQIHDWIFAADLSWIPMAFIGAQASCLATGIAVPGFAWSTFLILVIPTWLAWTLLSENLQLDGFRGGWRLSAVISHLLLAVALLMVLLLAVDNLSRRYSSGGLGMFGLLMLSGFIAIRWIALRLLLRRHRDREVNRIVILGSDRVATELAEKLNRHPELLCKVTGFLCAKAEFPGPQLRPASAITVSTTEITSLLRQQGVDELVLAHAATSPEILNLVALCREEGIRVSLVPQPYELYLSRPRLLDLDGLPLLQLAAVTPPAPARVGKRILDLTLGLFLSLVTLPLLLVCAAGVRYSRGRAFRWERRVGWRGAEFSMLRLNVDRDPHGGSRFERMLWQLSISELPQFWNVLRGDMSLVGPRPEGPERARRYSAWQQQRLTVKPGMTGLAQVNGLREQHSSEDKTRHDLQYLVRPSLLRDLSLLIETIWTLALRLAGARTRSVVSTTQHAAWSVPHSPSDNTFPEMFQHAHRTQPGSD